MLSTTIRRIRKVFCRFLMLFYINMQSIFLHLGVLCFLRRFAVSFSSILLLGFILLIAFVLFLHLSYKNA